VYSFVVAHLLAVLCGDDEVRERARRLDEAVLVLLLQRGEAAHERRDGSALADLEPEVWVHCQVGKRPQRLHSHALSGEGGVVVRGMCIYIYICVCVCVLEPEVWVHCQVGQRPKRLHSHALHARDGAVG